MKSIKVEYIRTPVTKKVKRVVFTLSPEYARALRNLAIYNVTVPKALRAINLDNSVVNDIYRLQTELTRTR